MNEFFPHRAADLPERLRHIENFLTDNSLRTPGAAGLSRVGSSITNGAVAISSGGGGELAGDVTGPIGSNLVSLLQGITLTITSPVTGQILTYDGTAILNSDTVTGSLTITGVLKTAGFQTALTSKSADYTLVYTDKAVEANATVAPFTLTLPTAVGHTGQEFEVKKIDATVNAVTIATTGGETIDGGATAVVTMPQTALGFRSTGSNWDIF